MRKALSLAAVGSVVAAGVVLGSGPAQAATATTCSGALKDVTVSGDLVVPAAKNCSLSGVRVTGNVYVDGALVSGTSQITGNVLARDNSYVNSWHDTIGGSLTFNGAWGGWISGSTIKGDLTSTEFTVAPSQVMVGDWTSVGGNLHIVTPADMTLSRIKVLGNYRQDSYFGSANAGQLNVGGNVDLNGWSGVWLNASTVNGTTTPSAFHGGDGTVTNNQLKNLATTMAMGYTVKNNRVSGWAYAPCHTNLAGSGNTFGRMLGEYAVAFGGAATCDNTPPAGVATLPNGVAASGSAATARKGAAHSAGAAKSTAADAAKSTAAVLAKLAARSAAVKAAAARG